MLPKNQRSKETNCRYAIEVLGPADAARNFVIRKAYLFEPSPRQQH